MDKQGKNYIYHVSSLSSYHLVPANDVADAIEAFHRRYEFPGPLIAVRPATPDEISLQDFHDEKVKEHSFKEHSS